MSLHKSTSYTLDHAASACPAYLIKFPQTVWEQIQAAVRSGEDISLSHDDIMTLDIGGSSVSLEAAGGGAATEIHRVSGSSMVHVASASTRLTVPLSSTSKRSDKVREKRPATAAPAVMLQPPETQVIHDSGTSPPKPSRRVSSPPPQPTGPVAPLKTRVMQALVLGPASVDDLVRRVGAVEEDVLRIVRVVGRVGSDTSCWELQPSQYGKIKLQGIKYSKKQLDRIQELVQAAFDELGLPSDADERVAFKVKMRELRSAETAPASSETATETVERSKPAETKAAKVDKIDNGEAQLPATKATTTNPSTKRLSNGESKAGTPSRVTNGKSTDKTGAESDTSAVPSLSGPNKPVTKKARPSLSPSISQGKLDADVPSPRPDLGRAKIKKKPRASSSVAKEAAKPKAISRDYSSSSSSDEDDRHALALKKRAREKREAAARAPDPEALRDRYEELFPAYQLLTEKLAVLHQRAEQTGQGQDEVLAIGSEDLRKMVAKWERWHAELSGIRRWFREEPAAA